MDLVQVECLSKCGFGDQELRNDDREQEGQKRAKKSGGRGESTRHARTKKVKPANSIFLDESGLKTAGLF